MTADDKPAPAHPAPWRWTEEALVDASGGDVIKAGVAFCSEDPTLDVDARSAALIAAAPEMEALLRRLVAAQASFETIVILRKDAPALLARIDATRAGG